MHPDSSFITFSHYMLKHQACIVLVAMVMESLIIHHNVIQTKKVYVHVVGIMNTNCTLLYLRLASVYIV